MATTSIKTLLHKKDDHSLSLQHQLAPALPCEGSDRFLLLEVHTTSFTSGELLWPEVNELTDPVPGFDVAGTVLSAPDESKLRPGDKVYGYTSVERPGAAREQHIALESELAVKPDALSWEEAATVPLSALTAWQALFVLGRLTPPLGESLRHELLWKDTPRVLVTAASGGVGVWAVQLAHLSGAYVVATCGPKNVEFVKGLGADEVLDYTTTPVGEWTAKDSQRQFDVVLDCKGGSTLTEAWTCVKAGGFLNSVAEPAEDRRPASGVAPDVKSEWFIVNPDAKQLTHISRLIEEKRCRAVMDSSWAFDDWSKAFQRLDSGHARGKVVLRIRE